MQDNNGLFKLIGIRVLPECDKSLRKVLRTDTTYFLCNDYEDDGEGGVRLRRDAQPLSPLFFCKANNWNGPKVNISCVVGHNGDGKSSLIELIIRLINNFAYLSGFLSDHIDLKFILGLHVKLFYLANNRVCCVSCLGDKVELMIGRNVTNSWNYTPGKMRQVKRTKRFFIEDTDTDYLFYTLISNYSLYAYNSEEFKSETNTMEAEESWIAALFHKNDAYQTPIVLAPHRKKGVFDVNRQYHLSMQRLSELFFDCRHGKYKISNTEKAEGVVYGLERESKLITKTISEYVSDLNRGARNVINLSGCFSAGKKRAKYNLDLSNTKELQLSLEFWEKFDRRFFNTGLISLANDNNNVIVTKGDTSGNLTIETDLDKYLNELKIKIKKRKGFDIARGNIEEFLGLGGGLTFMQFQRVFLVFEVYKQWLEKLGDDDLLPFNPNKMTVRDHAMWYLIYKTIRVIENYPDFMAGGLKDYEIPHYFFSEEVRNNNIHKWFKSIFNDIEKDKTHLTTKIRQTLNYLQNKETASLLLRKDFKSEELKKVVSESGYSYFLDCEQYYKAIGDKSDTSSELPPPIFDYDFVISRDDESLYSLSRMSSGERQLLNSASSVVYHLKNIANSKAQGIKIVYRNVNVMLEEVELYFHPEYQRQFINYLLDQIEFAKLPSTMAINLVFVTHSPFILSDIPRQQVLFLKDGKMDRSMQEDTFGANIHTLLQNGFFLGSVPIGEFAKEKISIMFKTLNKSESLTSKEFKQLSREIPLVSEPLIRSQLMRLYSQRKSFENGEYKAKIEALESRVHELEERLNDKN